MDTNFGFQYFRRSNVLSTFKAYALYTVKLVYKGHSSQGNLEMWPL